MTSPLNIKMVQGWSVHLDTNSDQSFKWQARAIKYSEEEEAIGRDANDALSRLAVKCGMLPGDMLKAFGMITEH